MPTSPWSRLDPHGAGLALQDFPSALLMRAAHTVQTGVTAVYARHNDLTVPEWRLLAKLSEAAPVQLGALCRITFFDKAHASRVLRSLADKGLVSQRVDEAHRRRQIVDVTPEGRALAERVMPVARASQARLLELLTAQEREALYGALRKLLQAGPELAPQMTALAPDSP